MGKHFQAIPTKYRGCSFRSRTEARWAVFFDFLGVPYQFEAEGFSMPEGPYLPDFYIPGANVWVEVKGAYPDAREMTKADALARGSGRPVYLYFGGVPYSTSQLDWKVYGIFVFMPEGGYGPGKDYVPWFEAENRDVLIEDALSAARGAQF